MTEMLRLFRQDDPYITLTGGTDCICASCPHSLSHVCDAAEKVQRYDSAVLMFCGLSVGSVLRWSEFTDRYLIPIALWHYLIYCHQHPSNHPSHYLVGRVLFHLHHLDCP